MISEKIKKIKESPTLAMAKKVRELKKQGLDIIDLSLGEPDLHPEENIKFAAMKAIMSNKFDGYSPVSGYGETRMAIANKLLEENKIDWNPENIVVSNGAKQSLFNAVYCLVNPNDEVIIFSPYWVSYTTMVDMADGKTVFCKGDFENNFKVTPKQLEDAITEKTKLIMFSSPSNPSGTVYTESEIRAFAKIIAKHENIYVISDEIYEYINFSKGGHFSIGSIPEIKEKVITINGISKGYGMTGWRIGYSASNKMIADAMDKLQGQTTSGPNSIAQKAAEEALTKSLGGNKGNKETYLRRRDLVVELLTRIKGFKINIPDGAFYAFPNISYYYGMTDGKNTIKNSNDFSLWLLENALVSTIAGSSSGEDNCIRISTATSDNLLIEACERIEEVVSRLK